MQDSDTQSDDAVGRLRATGPELAMLRGMNANSDASHPAVPQGHHRAFVNAMGWVALVGGLVVYLGGLRWLLHQAALWLAMCWEIIRRALGCP